MKSPLTYLLPLTLSACMNFSDVEKQALADRAVADARAQSKAVHMAYLQCYALPDVDKSFCENDIRKSIKNVQAASSWEYIRTFDYEAERLGFAEFLREHGKSCKGIDAGPKYNAEKKAYDVRCNDGNGYTMQFDSRGMMWRITD